MRSIASRQDGIAFLHQRGLAHGNVAPTNVMVSGVSATVIKVSLCDYGVSTLMRSAVAVCGSQHGVPYTLYSAPEALETAAPLNAPSKLAADVWGFGCLLVTMVTRAAPYADTRRRLPALDKPVDTPSLGVGAAATLHAALHAADGAARPAEGLTTELKVPDDVTALITDCTSLELAARPTAAMLAIRVLEAKQGYGWKGPMPQELLTALKQLKAWHDPGAKAAAAAKPVGTPAAKPGTAPAKGSFWSSKRSSASPDKAADASVRRRSLTGWLKASS